MDFLIREKNFTSLQGTLAQCMHTMDTNVFLFANNSMLSSEKSIECNTTSFASAKRILLYAFDENLVNFG